MQRRQVIAFVLAFLGIPLLATMRSREFLTDYALFVSLGYQFCWPRDARQPYGEYIRDPAIVAMAALLSLGGGVLIYSLITGHY